MNDRDRCVQILSADNVTILDLEGEIDIYTATDFKEAMLDSIAGGQRHIVVDATKVTFMDSSGLSVLVGGMQRLRPLGGDLSVACDDRVGRLLKLTGLNEVLPHFPTREDALRAQFGRVRPADAAPDGDPL